MKADLDFIKSCKPLKAVPQEILNSISKMSAERSVSPQDKLLIVRLISDLRMKKVWEETTSKSPKLSYAIFMSILTSYHFEEVRARNEKKKEYHDFLKIFQEQVLKLRKVTKRYFARNLNDEQLSSLSLYAFCMKQENPENFNFESFLVSEKATERQYPMTAIQELEKWVSSQIMMFNYRRALGSSGGSAVRKINAKNVKRTYLIKNLACFMKRGRNGLGISSSLIAEIATVACECDPPITSDLVRHIIRGSGRLSNKNF